MENNHEKVEDIEAEIRRIAATTRDGVIAINGHVIADRLKAARENELLSSACHNSSAIRKALEFCIKQMSDAICDKDFGDDVVYLVGCMQVCVEYMKQALVTPHRNCDRFESIIDAKVAFLEYANRVYGPVNDKYKYDLGDLKHNLDDLAVDYAEWLMEKGSTDGE